MKTNTLITAAVSTLALAGFTYAVSAPAPQSMAHTVAHHMDGAWAKDSELTRRLDPDRSVWDLETLQFTFETKIPTDVPKDAEPLVGGSVLSYGTLRMNGKAHPFVLATRNDNLMLVWWSPKDNVRYGEAHTGFVSMVLARDTYKDLLFLGGEPGARAATVCFTRSMRTP